MPSPVRICFVCLGNICRSPTAEAVFLKLVEGRGLRDSVVVDSAGTGGWHTGERADPRSRATAAARGIDITSRSRQFTADDFARFDHVVAMDASNQRNLERLAPTDEARAKVVLFRSFDPDAPPGAEVPDPYYNDRFEDVLDMCEAAAAGLLERVVAGRS